MPQTDEHYLKLFFALPDLFDLAIHLNSTNRYQIQDELREQYREQGTPYRWSMPLRSFGFCRQCNEKFTQIIYELEHPQLKIAARTSASHLHAIRQHGAPLDAELKRFLIAVG